MNNTVPVDFDLDALRDPSLGAPGTTPAREREERHLRIATPAPAGETRRRRSPLMGSLIAVGVILGIMGAQLGLSIAVSQGAYETRALEIEQRDLARVERVLSQNVDKLSSPQNLAENAAALGMVQNSHPATLRLSNGAVLGALESKTTEARENLVPNATLKNMPVVDAKGLLVSRSSGQAADDQVDPTQAPVRWKGKLPAPETH
ncbi:hypothetical protein JD292_05440 [Leucobacter sp. CSA2]|uniref:Cell division protein FtsL n=1 Tax=Leucobacter edaphi TaxID=2796472 RepID=A0A934QB81_9MICO|nr:hypothetical protein [Leucobacter edaphi]MBK0421515.1 hypothetical protein [Leucobacter edaphi]